MAPDTRFVLVLCLVGAAGSYVGARLATTRIAPLMLRRIFVTAIIGTTSLRAPRLLA